MELPQGAQVEHPAMRESTLRACPTCTSENPDWQDRVLTELGLPTSSEPL